MKRAANPPNTVDHRRCSAAGDAYLVPCEESTEGDQRIERSFNSAGSFKLRSIRFDPSVSHASLVSRLVPRVDRWPKLRFVPLPAPYSTGFGHNRTQVWLFCGLDETPIRITLSGNPALRSTNERIDHGRVLGPPASGARRSSCPTDPGR